MPSLHPVLTVELVGSYVAVHRESGITADLTNQRNRNTTKSALPALARKLIAAGHDPQDRVHVIRKAMTGDRSISVFNRDRKLLIWAGVDIIEDVARGPREIEHRPYSGPVTVAVKNTRDVGEASADAPKVAKLTNAANGNTASAPHGAGEVR